MTACAAGAEVQGRAKFCHECGAVMSTLAALRGTRLG
jgi:hypothetical protein